MSACGLAGLAAIPASLLICRTRKAAVIAPAVARSQDLTISAIR